jgi:mRNA export factor
VIESPLKYATTAVDCFPDGKGFCIGSIEGRCCVKNFDYTLKVKGYDNYTFKCHIKKQAIDKTVILNSVNGFCFNKRYGTFYSYGSDGSYISWNKDTKAKYRTSECFPGSVVAADQTDEGTIMAYAIGYDWSQGSEGAK